MAFRGFGDDAMKVAADQREYNAKMASIAASERASRRSASVALAGQAEQAREADQNVALKEEQLAAQTEEAAAGRAASAAESEKSRAFVAEQGALGREASALESDKSRMFTAEQGDLTREQNRGFQERQMRINEETYNRLNQQWTQEQEAQAERQMGVNAATMAALRAAAISGKPAPPIFLNAINGARGKVHGEPGSITGLFPIVDDKGNRLGFGVTEIDKEGNTIEKALDPVQVLPKMMSQMKPEDAEFFTNQLISGNRSAFEDKLTLLAKEHAAKLEVEKQKTAAAEAKLNSPAALTALREQEMQVRADVEKAKKTGTPNAEAENLLKITRQKIASITAGMGSSGAAAPAAEGATDGTTSRATAKKAVRVVGDRLKVTIGTKVYDYPDIPKNRAALKERGLL